MKQLFLLLLTCSAFASIIQSALADPPQRKVTVLGTATIKVVPDEMKWTVYVNGREATLIKAKELHDVSLTAALKVIKDLHDAAKDLQTGGISFDKEQLYVNMDPDIRAHPYTCSTRITFTLVDFDKYGATVDALSKIDGIRVESAEYASSKEKETRREALKQALLNAHDKASDLATTAGCYIDKPLDIVEEGATISPFPEYSRIGAAAPGSSQGPIPGQLDITTSVTATYDLFYK